MTVVTTEQVRRFARVFAGRVSAYGRYDESSGAKRVWTKQEAIPSDAYEKHLLGQGPYLGIIPIREDNTCLFGAIDIDEDGIDLDAIDAKIHAFEMPLVVVRSKSGGAHLYLFLAEPAPARTVVDALKRFRATLGRDKNPDGRPVEIFPKQTATKPTDPGNWINMPYWGHDGTNRYAVAAGKKLDLDAFLDLAEQRRINERVLQAWIDPSIGPFSDGPPCLQQLHRSGFPEGSRNTGLLNVGIFLRAKYPDAWEDALVNYNASLDAPLADRELQQIIRNLSRHEYLYTCEQHPIQPLCQKKECKKQQFGIGFFLTKLRLAEIPELADLVKVLTDPPQYRVKVNGAEIPLSSEQLQSPLLFKRLIFEQLNLVMPANVKPHEWDELLKKLLESQRQEEAPPEAGDRGLAVMFLRDFLMMRSKADGLEDVLRGLPWLDERDSRVYFRATDFAAFLQRRQFRHPQLPDRPR